MAFSALKWCGVVYLLYMAWQTLHERGALAVDGRIDEERRRRVVVTGFLINILNPKLSIFFLAFLPQFIATGEPHPLARMLELSAVFMLMTWVVFVVYGLFAASVRDRVVSRPNVMTWLRRAFAGGLPCSARGWRSRIAEQIDCRNQKAGQARRSSIPIRCPGGAEHPTRAEELLLLSLLGLLRLLSLLRFLSHSILSGFNGWNATREACSAEGQPRKNLD